MISRGSTRAYRTHADQVQLGWPTALARRHPKKLAKLVAVVRELVA